MNGPSWSRVKRVFQRAVELEGTERDAFVEEACAADRALRAEVASLLAAHDEAGDFISRPLIAVDPQDFEQPATFPHQQIGPYRIVEELGAGGMGHVYRGVRVDGEIDQQVAIKIIRASRATPSILQRFRHERQIMYEVRHANIGGLLDGGTTDDGLPYFIMDYVDGEPIDTYCDRHELSIRERLELFLKVCDAVHFAHSKRVVHRDLKPGNILVTADGEPKLLDFGIAKSVAEEAEDAEQTKIGERVLTPAYASPEQVRGLKITPASDVYSLGVLLYLLLTGLRPYNLDEAVDYEKVICEKRPIPPSLLLQELLHAEDTEGIAPAVSPRRVARARRASPAAMREELLGNLDGIVLAALEKGADDRYESVADLAADIRRHLDGAKVLGPSAEGLPRSPTQDPFVSTSEPPPPSMTAFTRRAVPTLFAVLALAAVLVLAAAWLAGVRPGPDTAVDPSMPNIEYPLMPPDGVAFTEGARSVPTVSPDGDRVLYVSVEANGSTGLRLHRIGGDSPSTRIEGTDDAMYPFWSADAEWVGFFAGGRLRFAYVDGAPGRELSVASLEARGATANADDLILFAGDRGDSLRRVDFSGDNEAIVTRPRPEAGEIALMWPQFLPDGEHFLFFIASDAVEVEGVYVGSLDDPDLRQRLLPSTSSAWYASGHLLYLRDDTLMARPFDAATLEWAGDERSVGLRVATTVIGQAAFTASRAGVLAYRRPATRRARWFDPTRREIGEIGAPANQRNPVFSAVSRRVAIETQTGNRNEIVVFDADGRRNRVQTSSTFVENPVWHPDGRRLAFVGRFLDEHALYLWNADSNASSVELFSSPSEKMPGDITADGRYLVYDDKGADSVWNIRAVDLLADEPTPLDVITTTGHDTNGRVSPSGELIAYVTDTSGAPHVYVQPFSVGNARDAGLACWVSDADGGYDPHWGATDNEIYYLRPDGRLIRVGLNDPLECDLGDPDALFDSGIDTPGSSRNHYTVDFDGPRFLFATPVAQDSSRHITTNWLERLPR